jgi:hypothetical protein
LPKEFALRGTLSITAPTGYYSQVCNVITVPSASVGASKKLKWFNFDARVFGSVSIVRTAQCTGVHGSPTGDTEAPGGSPNPIGSLGIYLDAEYALPWHDRLTVGADFYTGWTWLYDVHGSAPLPPTSYGYPAGSTGLAPSADPNYGTSQPVQQSYGGEVYLRYSFPAVKGIKSDFTFAFAQGDPTLGYTSVLHDGIGHVYAFWRQNSEFYGVLSARY